MKSNIEDIIDLEIRLLKTITEGPSEVKSYLVSKLKDPNIFIYIPNSWALATSFLERGATINLSTFSHAAISDLEKGFVESAVNETCIETIEEVEEITRSILEHYYKQKLVASISEPISKLNSGTARYEETLHSLLDTLEKLSSDSAAEDFVTGLGENHDAEKVKDLLFSEEEGDIIPIGIDGLDERAGGFSRGDLVICACPSSHGKTTFMIQLTLNIALGLRNREYKNLPLSALFISLEMTDKQIWKRILSNLLRIPVAELRDMSKLDVDIKNKLMQLIDSITAYLVHYHQKFTIIGSSSSNMLDIRAELAAHKYDLLVIDYLNLMAEGEQLWSEMGAVARELKLLAQRHNLVCITAAQLDEERLKIRYSGMLREHCDVLLIWALGDTKVQETPQEIFVNKGRNIGVFTFWTYFDFNMMEVRSFDPVAEFGMNVVSPAKQGSQLENMDALALPGTILDKISMDHDPIETVNEMTAEQLKLEKKEVVSILEVKNLDATIEL